MKDQISNVSDIDMRSAYQRAVDFGISQGISQGRWHEQEAILAQLSSTLDPASLVLLRGKLGTDGFRQALVETLAAR